jgi:hypothetical protein
MRLKHKIYYVAIGVILLAVFQVGFQLRPQLAFAASHGHDETEGEKFKLVKIGSLKATTTTTVLPTEGSLPKFEVSTQGSGTLAGVNVTTMATYWAEMRPDGTLYGECPAGGIMTQDGVATFRATGTGSFTADGGAIFRGAVYLQAAAPSLSSLNGTCGMYEWDVDAEGNATWNIWEWK